MEGDLAGRRVELRNNMSFDFKTIPEILFDTHAARSRDDCLVWKNDGIWQEMSTSEVLRAALEIGSGLRRSGLVPGERVGILAPSSVHWFLFDLGAQCAGCITVPLFDNLSEEHFLHEVNDAGIRMIFVADANQNELVARLLPGMRVVSLETLEGIESLDALRAGHEPAALERLRSDALAIDTESLATIIYTSGSTGTPKGVEIQHRALANQINVILQRFPFDPSKDVSLTCLPMAHVFERMVVLYHFASGVRLVFAENVQAVGANLREHRATVVTVVPRLLEKIVEAIETASRNGSLFKRLLAGIALAEAARPPSLLRAPLRALCDLLVYRRIRALMGGRLRLVVCGGAALSGRMDRMFRAFRVPLYQGYGLTEHSPVIAANYPGHDRRHSVGPLFPGVEARIAPDGELLVRSKSIMRGYWNRPEETAEAIDADGWLHTGDLGRFDEDGFLFLTGRKKEMCKTATGKYVVPGPIEDRLAGHKGVEHAVIFADDRKFVSALLTPDIPSIRRRMQEIGFKGTVQEYVDGPLQGSIGRHVERVNKKLDSWSRIRRWAVVPPFTIEGGDLTPTQKVRREAVYAKHASVVEGFYASGE
jgi:long-chain acyl-CoA synthetase